MSTNVSPVTLNLKFEIVLLVSQFFCSSPDLFAGVHKQVMWLLLALWQVFPHPYRLCFVISVQRFQFILAAGIRYPCHSYIPGWVLQSVSLNKNVVKEAQWDCDSLPGGSVSIQLDFPPLCTSRKHLLQLLILPVITSSCCGRNTSNRKVTWIFCNFLQNLEICRSFHWQSTWSLNLRCSQFYFYTLVCVAESPGNMKLSPISVMS